MSKVGTSKKSSQLTTRKKVGYIFLMAWLGFLLAFNLTFPSLY